jgi:hypothetical protein
MSPPPTVNGNSTTQTPPSETDDDETTDGKDASGDCCETTPGQVGEGGTVIQGPGRLTFTSGMVFISNNTGFGDSTAIWWNGGPKQQTGVAHWGDIVNGLANVPNGSLQNIYISGHGSGTGGISTLQTDSNANTLTGGPNNSGLSSLDGRTLTQDQATIIASKLAPGGSVIILGCDQATHGPGMQRLANQLNVPVIGNTGNVGWGNYGSGQWARWNPNG